MSPDQACIDFIKHFEGFKPFAYQDSAGIWTIGFGTIVYQDGNPVRQGETVNEIHAESLLQWEINLKSKTVDGATRNVLLTQNQYNALVSFAYNTGAAALIGSTLLQRVKSNPRDPKIRDAFMMWDKAHVDGKLVEIKGLKNRRTAEADLYFS